MTTLSVVMMLVAMVIIWGGLIASILYLRSRPEVIGGPHEDPDLIRDDEERGRDLPPIRDT